MAKGTLLVATVKGDIHDIGKNIAKTVLSNYGTGWWIWGATCRLNRG